MRWLFALLLMTTAAQAQLAPVQPWGNGDQYPHMSWPGYCAPAPFHPADIPTSTRACPNNTENVPPFSIDSGITFPFPGEPGYSPSELDDRRVLMIQQVFGQTVAADQPITNIPQFTIHRHLVDDPSLPPFGANVQTISTGTNGMCSQTGGQGGTWWNLGAPRIWNQGYCNPFTGINDPPAFGNISPYADVMTFRNPNFNGNSFSGFPGDNNQWWVYYPEHGFNNRVLIWLSGTAGWCNWPSMGNGAGSRPVMARALNEGFAVAMGFGRSCSGWSAGISNNAQMAPFFMMTTAFINAYEASGQGFSDYNQSGNSRGGMFTRMCAFDRRIKVAYSQAGFVPGWMFSTGQPIIFYHGQDGDDKSPFYLSLNNLFDEFVECSSGLPGARLRESGYFWNDQYMNDGFFRQANGNGVAQVNAAGWDGRARCNNAATCDNENFHRALTYLFKHTNAAAWGLPCSGPLCTQNLVPPENAGGVRRFGPSPGNADGQQHTTARLGRATLFQDLWQIGTQTQGHVHG